MKKLYLALIFFFSLIYTFPQNKIFRYKIEVKNKTVYARVFCNGDLVDNLTKDDFILYENGKRRKIESVEIIRKTLGEENITFNIKTHNSYEPRYFVLTFDILDYGPYLEKGINYLFEKILRKSDKLMFMSKNYFFTEDNLSSKDKIKKKMLNILKRESILARMELNSVFSQIRSIKSAIKEYFASQRWRNPEFFDPREIQMIKDKTLMFLRWYKKRYLIPDIDKFYYFAQYLNKIRMKKWVLNFYQIKKIPIPKEIVDFWNKEGSKWAFDPLQSEFDIPHDFPSEEIKKLFYKVDTTFYTFLLTKDRETLDKDYVFKNVYTDLEKTLKEITFSTGGDVNLSNNIEESFRKFKRKKDIIYLINYPPSVNNPKIKIKMKNSKYKVKYDPNQFSDYIKNYIKKKKRENPEIEIKAFKFKENTISFRITNFKTQKGKGGIYGKVIIFLKITDTNGNTVLNERKNLIFSRKSGKIKIKLNNIKAGIYHLYLDSFDLLTKKMASRFEIIEIK